MTMSNADICLEYKQAKNKANQVTVLADLNQCTRKEILDILEAEGVTIDKRLRGHPKEVKKTASEKQTTPAKKPAPAAAPNPEGVTLTRDEAEALLGLLADVLPEYIQDKAANMDLLEVHQLTGIYQKCL
jgi:hypothetical protein